MESSSSSNTSPTPTLRTQPAINDGADAAAAAQPPPPAPAAAEQARGGGRGELLLEAAPAPVVVPLRELDLPPGMIRLLCDNCNKEFDFDIDNNKEGSGGNFPIDSGACNHFFCTHCLAETAFKRVQQLKQQQPDHYWLNGDDEDPHPSEYIYCHICQDKNECAFIQLLYTDNDTTTTKRSSPYERYVNKHACRAMNFWIQRENYWRDFLIQRENYWRDREQSIRDEYQRQIQIIQQSNNNNKKKKEQQGTETTTTTTIPEEDENGTTDGNMQSQQQNNGGGGCSQRKNDDDDDDDEAPPIIPDDVPDNPLPVPPPAAAAAHNTQRTTEYVVVPSSSGDGRSENNKPCSGQCFGCTELAKDCCGMSCTGLEECLFVKKLVKNNDSRLPATPEKRKAAHNEHARLKKNKRERDRKKRIREEERAAARAAGS